MAKKNLIKRRPAETAALSGGVLAAALIQAFEIPARFAALITLGSALLAPVVTSLVERYGKGKQVVDAID